MNMSGECTELMDCTANICASGVEWWKKQSTPVKIVAGIGGTLIFGAVVAGVVFWAMSDCTSVTIQNKSGATMHFDNGKTLYDGSSWTIGLPGDNVKDHRDFDWGNLFPSDCELVTQNVAPYAEVKSCDRPNAFVAFPGCRYDIEDKYQVRRLNTFFQSSKPAANEVPVKSFDVKYTEEELDALQADLKEVSNHLRGSFSAQR